MTAAKTTFKSSTTEKRWIALQKEKAELQAKKQTPAIAKKTEMISSLMTSCKVGFALSEAKVKKTIKFLQESTGLEKFKYGILPDNVQPHSILFKDTVIIYAEKDGVVLFKEFEG